jgi:hypothetical protein
VQITDSVVADPDYIADAYSLYVKTNIQVGGNIYATEIVSAPVDNAHVFLNQETSGDTDWYWGINGDSEGDDDDSMVLGTGSTVGSNVKLTIDTSGNVTAPGYVKGSYVVLEGGTYDTTIQPGTPAASVSYTWPSNVPGASGYALTSTTGGIMSWSAITATADGEAAEVQFRNSSTGALASDTALQFNTTNNTLSITQAASNPTLQIGDGTYSWNHTPQVGVEGVAEFDANAFFNGGIVLGSDGTVTTAGEVGYATNAFTFYANSENMIWTAGTNTWTYSSGTGANLVLGTPSATSLTVGALEGVNSIDATGEVDMDYGSADVTDHTFVSDGGTVVIDGSVTAAAGVNLGTSQALIGTTAMTIGNNNQTVAVNSSDWDIGATGDVTGLGAIGADGLITFTNATEASAVGTAAVVLSGGLGVAKDVWVGDDINMASNGAVLTLGADSSVTLTHSASTLTLAGTLALGANNLTMTGDIAATGARVNKGWFAALESTAIPSVNGVAGNATNGLVTNPMTTAGDLIVGGASGVSTGRLAGVAAGQPLLSGGVGTAPAYAGYTFSATAAQTYTFPGATSTLARTDAGQTFTGVQAFTAPTVATSIAPASADGATLGTAAAEFSDLYLADGGEVLFGNDQDVQLTHVADTGLLLGDGDGTGTTQLQFGDSGTYINQSTDGTLNIVGDTIAQVVAPNIKLAYDAAAYLNVATADGGATTISATSDGADIIYLGDNSDDQVRMRSVNSTTNETWSGHTIYFAQCAATMGFGQPAYIQSSGKPGLADADAAATMPAIGLVVVASTDADTPCTVLTHGVITDTDWAWTPGGTLYVADGDAGALTATIGDISDENDVVQVVGIAIHADSIFVNPSLATAVLAAP